MRINCYLFSPKILVNLENPSNKTTYRSKFHCGSCVHIHLCLDNLKITNNCSLICSE